MTDGDGTVQATFWMPSDCNNLRFNYIYINDNLTADTVVDRSELSTVLSFFWKTATTL